jgi:hypothetical protein
MAFVLPWEHRLATRLALLNEGGALFQSGILTRSQAAPVLDESAALKVSLACN